jgi:hypothetical protein
MVRLNFTDTEAYGNSSLGRDALPNGKYHVAITDVDVRESGPGAKHPGSEYWAIEFTVQEGDYKGRKMWTNATMLPHALYTIKGILEAIGRETTGNELEVEPDDLVNEELIVRAVKKGATQVRKSDGTMTDVDERNEVKGFYTLASGIGSSAPKKGAAVAASGGSLLP